MNIYDESEINWADIDRVLLTPCGYASRVWRRIKGSHTNKSDECPSFQMILDTSLAELRSSRMDEKSMIKNNESETFGSPKNGEGEARSVEGEKKKRKKEKKRRRNSEEANNVVGAVYDLIDNAETFNDLDATGGRKRGEEISDDVKRERKKRKKEKKRGM